MIFQILGDAPVRIDHMIGYDSVEFDDAANVNYTKDGYLTASPRVARTGVQIYDGSECGGKAGQKIRVYRPEDQVFAPAAMRSLTHRPMTIDHPPVPVTADNWKKYAVGQSGDETVRDGNTIRVPMVLMDSAAIAAFKEGKRELSVGYTCDLIWKEGTTLDGEPYDAVQVGIIANHIAVVDSARGGSSLKIGDDKFRGDWFRDMQGKDGTMTMKMVAIDGIQVEMSDTAAQVVQRTMAQMQDTINKMKADADAKKKKDDEDEANDCKMKADTAAKIAAQDATIATLQKQLADAKLTPQQLDAMVTERVATIGKARAAAGGTLATDGKSIEDIRRAVVDSKLGPAAKGWDDNQIRASFDTLTAGIVPDAGGSMAGRPGGGYQPFAPVASGDPRAAAFADSVKSLNEAWRMGKTA